MAVLREVRRNREFPLHSGLTLVGRDPGCDIVADSQLVSSRHFIILNTKGTYSVEDLDSMNGTFVNRQRLTGRVRLNSGDRIDVFGLTLVFDKAEADFGREVTDHPGKVGSTMSGVPDRGTIRPTELLEAYQVPELSSLEVNGDLRLSVKPEAKLRAVLEIARNLSRSLDLKVVLPQILDSLFAIFPAADCGFILLRNQQTGELIPGAVKYRGRAPVGSLPVSHGIIQQVLVSGRAILSHDAGSDSRIASTASIRHLDIRSVMCVPINREDGECMGVIQLDSRDLASQFNDGDLALLVCTSLLAGRAVEVVRLHEERRDLEAASEIQRSLLPTARPRSAGLQFFDHYAPAQRVSGDYFDYISLPGNRLAVAVGDVAGKGIAAALLMAHLAAATRISLANSPSLSDAVRQLNVLLIQSGCDDRFITFVVAVLDLDHFSLTIVNAGHPPPLLRRGKKRIVEELAGELAGLPLGVRDRPYEQIETVLEPGDTLLLYTDGVSEMRNRSSELYGTERLHAAILASPGGAEDTGNALLADLKRFAQARLAGDDVTVLCVGRSES